MYLLNYHLDVCPGVGFLNHMVSLEYCSSACHGIQGEKQDEIRKKVIDEQVFKLGKGFKGFEISVRRRNLKRWSR